jgi:hypothetical protein
MTNGFVINFDASQVDPRQSEGGICLPLADYPMEIVGIEQVQNKDDANKGHIAIKLKVLDGQYANQVQVDRLNIYGQAETPTRIAYQRLSAYCHVAGKLRVQNANELVGTKLIATCGPQNPPNDKYSEVKLVKDIAGNPPTFGQPSAPQSAGFSQQPQQPQQPQQGGFPVTTAAPFPGASQPAQGGWSNPAQQPQQPQQGTAWGATQPAQQPAQGGSTPPWAK